MTRVRPVSTSEAGSLAKCETLWKYSHHPAYNLEPLTTGPAITRGVTGHSALEAFYKRIKAGVPYDEAAKAITNKLIEAALKAMSNGDSNKSQMYSELAVIMEEYFAEYRSDVEDWEILSIEEKLELPDFIGRLDLVIRYRRGPHVGEIAPVDHKFLYNFWNASAYKMSPQAPNYIRALRALYPNERITHMLYNQIRFRMDAKDRFCRYESKPSTIKIRNFAKNHAIMAERITRYRELSREEVDATVSRAVVKTTCEYCVFSDLCDAQLEQLDTTNMERFNFNRNSYGYTDEPDA